MSLKLYFHPLASFCHKALIALYENEVPFEPVVVDLGDPASAASFKAVWPMAKMPVLVDQARGCAAAESTIVIDYLDAHYPGRNRFVPADPDIAWRTRFWDRFYDFYVEQPMQKIVTDNLRPPGGADPHGVEQAKVQLREAYGVIEAEMAAGKQWAMGDAFTLADCSAAPALFYANTVVPLGPEHENTLAYLGRLMRRPSHARVLREAEPYFRMFPLASKPDIAPPAPAAIPEGDLP